MLYVGQVLTKCWLWCPWKLQINCWEEVTQQQRPTSRWPSPSRVLATQNIDTPPRPAPRVYRNNNYNGIDTIPEETPSAFSTMARNNENMQPMSSTPNTNSGYALPMSSTPIMKAGTPMRPAPQILSPVSPNIQPIFQRTQLVPFL